MIQDGWIWAVIEKESHPWLLRCFSEKEDAMAYCQILGRVGDAGPYALSVRLDDPEHLRVLREWRSHLVP